MPTITVLALDVRGMRTLTAFLCVAGLFSPLQLPWIVLNWSP